MNENKIHIAYIGMEIPALSATFIYNEIISLENNNFEVLPISVHYPGTMAEGKNISRLKDKTFYLYNTSLWILAFSNIKCFLKFPVRYLHTLIIALKDAFKAGILSHTGMGILYRFFAASRVAEIIIRSNCRHIHSHFAHVATDLAMYASGISGIAFSFTSHANDLFERGWLLKEKVERSKFAVTISEYNTRFLADQGAPQNKIHVIHCGVDTESFYRKADQSINNIPKIGAIGRMVDKKGFDTLINACAILKNMKQPFILEIAGSGPLYDDLQELVNKNDLTEEISLIGALPHEQIINWLKEKDIFALPCRKDKHGDIDGIPVVLMEAMAMGVPVISSRISGIPELVEDGVSGLLINENDSEALSRSIVKIITDENLRKTITINAIKKVEDEFELSKNSSRLSNLFKEAIG